MSAENTPQPQQEAREGSFDCLVDEFIRRSGPSFKSPYERIAALPGKVAVCNTCNSCWTAVEREVPLPYGQKGPRNYEETVVIGTEVCTRIQQVIDSMSASSQTSPQS